MEKLIEKYRALGIDKIIDHDKFNSISIVHHSTVLEGSTLTETETTVLITDGLTPKGKPLTHSLMVQDHYAALNFALAQAKEKKPVTINLIQQIGGLVLKNTGASYNTLFGLVDATKGEFRKGNVTAGSTYFPNYDKVPKLMDDLVNKINEKMGEKMSVQEKLNLSFDAHFNMVSIHPFYDGNGRSSRLLMNYIQEYYKLPLAIVHAESKVDYIQALQETREKNDINIFRAFMGNEYTRQLTSEIQKFENSIKPKSGYGFSILF